MKRYIFWAGIVIAIALTFIPNIKTFASGIALLCGLLLASFNLIDRVHYASSLRKITLNTAVVMFGFGLNIQQVITVGTQGLLQTILSLTIVIVFGFIFVKLFKIQKTTGSLIVFGTAICGGSAIAATAPLLDATDDEIGISTGVIFLLNTVALFLFSFFASSLSLSAHQFGTWSALSIHDTSSVIGAASVYSNEALQIATITKLTRTLWIIPIVLILAFFNKEKQKVSFPYFIIFFIFASIIASLFNLPNLYTALNVLGKVLLSVALYLVGTSLSPRTIQQAGIKSIMMGVSLWIISIISGYIIAVIL